MNAITRSILFPSLAVFPGTRLITILACAALAALSQMATAAPGDLDLTFGGTGKVTTGVGSGNDQATSLAVQADGKIVVAGYSSIGGTYDFALVRYNANGSLDTSFNGTGKVTTGFFGSSFDYGNSVAVQSDGKIVVAGRSDSPGITRIALVRYNANGSLDTSFNGTGKVTTSIGSGGAAASSMAIQSDGKIIVGGSSDNGSSFHFALVRYDANGSLDTSFNGTGTVTTSFGSGNDEGRSVAVQSDGKIVVAGTFYSAGTVEFALVRYNANGSLDTSFNGTGKVTTTGTGNDQGNSVAVQSDGKIVIAGYSTFGGNNDFTLVRYNADGSLDTSFNGTGEVSTAIGVGDDQGYSVAIQSDGKIVVTGVTDGGGNYDLALMRYNADGSPDLTFSSTGSVTTAIGSSYDQGSSVALQGDGKIVVAGFSNNAQNNYDFALVRFQGGVVPEPSTFALLGLVIPVLFGTSRLRSRKRGGVSSRMSLAKGRPSFPPGART